MGSYVATENQRLDVPVGLLSSVGILEASPRQQEGIALS